MNIRRDVGTWKTKLRKIQELSKSKPEVVFSNVYHTIDGEMLNRAYDQLAANKAVGIDGVAKDAYGANLEENLQGLLEALQKETYKAKPSRLVEIPKEDGSVRTLAIGSLEDKIVQMAVYWILQAIYEPQFLDCSYGFRPRRSCHEALKELHKQSYPIWDGCVIEVDITQCFDTIPHGGLMAVLDQKISDRKFKRLVGRILKSPIAKDGQVHITRRGCPQGNIVSPMLANIYLHEVLDKWFESLKGRHIKRHAALIRYCDDSVMVFADPKEGQRVYDVLGKRLAKYGLERHPVKSKILPIGRKAAQRAQDQGQKLETYQFLGFTCYYGKGLKGGYRLKYTSRKDRFTVKLKEIRKHLRSHLTVSDSWGFLGGVAQKVRGWINYHAVSDNQRRVKSFLIRVEHQIYWWYNRRGKKNAMRWGKLRMILDQIGYPKTFKSVSMFR